MSKNKATGNTSLLKTIIALAIIIFLALVPMMGLGSYNMLICCLICIYVISTSGLDILFGYSGQISMGHAAFYAIGAYGSAIFSKLCGLSPWLSMPLAAVIAAIIGFLFALPISKLKFMFLSLVTTGFGEVVYQIIVNFWPEVFGSTAGFKKIPKFEFFGLVIKDRSHYYLLVLAIALIMLLIKHMIIESKVGRAFIAVRESTEAAGAMGINTTYYKSLAFAISAFYVSIAGSLYAHMIGYISPETYVRATSVMFLTIVLLGGRGSFSGPIIGSVILIICTEMIQAFGRYQQLIYGLFIIIVVLFMPKGIAGAIGGIIHRIRVIRQERRNQNVT